jgi:murein L,D-transpeptidase YcbB/YkuD
MALLGPAWATAPSGGPAALEAAVDALTDRESLSSILALQRFYEGNGYQPVWTAGERKTRRLGHLLAAIEASAAQGLEPVHYHLDAIRRGLTEPPADPTERAQLELRASDAWMLLAGHYHSGLVNPLSLDPQWHAARRDFDGAQALDRALGEGDPVGYLVRQLPVDPYYARLVVLLGRYRAMPDWEPLAAGPALEPGARGPSVAQLRRRLAAEPGLPDPDAGDEAFFDQHLALAVRAYQERHGLVADGVVGTATRRELDTPRAQRVEQLRVNLERLRWLPADLGRRHVRVNIADYSLQAWDDGMPALAMKTIVGRSYRRTPVFSAEMDHLVLNPSWYVPRRIAVQDKLPLIREDPGYLERHGYEVLAEGRPVDPATVDWAALGPDDFPYLLRQRPGPGNALGKVKFMMPNPFDVYLHDTDDRDLFREPRRSFSSGCIRLEQPLELLDWALAETPAWPPQAARMALDSGEERRVALDRPIPVHIEYRTAWVHADGTAQFRPDLYGRDRLVAAALERGPQR